MRAARPRWRRRTASPRSATTITGSRASAARATARRGHRESHARLSILHLLGQRELDAALGWPRRRDPHRPGLRDEDAARFIDDAAPAAGGRALRAHQRVGRCCSSIARRRCRSAALGRHMARGSEARRASGSLSRQRGKRAPDARRSARRGLRRSRRIPAALDAIERRHGARRTTCVRRFRARFSTTCRARRTCSRAPRRIPDLSRRDARMGQYAAHPGPARIASSTRSRRTTRGGCGGRRADARDAQPATSGSCSSTRGTNGAKAAISSPTSGTDARFSRRPRCALIAPADPPATTERTSRHGETATRSTPSPAASPPSSTPAPPASSRPRAQHKRSIGKRLRRPQRHHRRADRGPDRHRARNRARAIAALTHTPAGAFGSCRYKLEGPRREPRAVRAPDRRVPRARHRLFLLQRRQRFGRHLPQGLADRRDARLSAASRCTCRRPSTTISPVTDCCPGFGSVAKYVATSMREAAFDVASMAKTSTKVFVLEVMGRHAGWITAAVGLADDAATPIPLRAAVSRDRVRRGEVPRARSMRRSKRFGYCCIGVSEGLQNAEGKLMAEAGHARTRSATRSSAASGR